MAERTQLALIVALALVGLVALGLAGWAIAEGKDGGSLVTVAATVVGVYGGASLFEGRASE